MTDVTAVKPSKIALDWYAATVEKPGVELISTLSASLGAEAREVRGLHGYRQGFELRVGDHTAGRVLVGGSNPHPHAFASGSDSELFAEIVRREFPGHRVTRLDSAADYAGEGTWASISSVALGVADRMGLKVGYAGDWHRGLDGRTLYIGSRSSAVFVRIYEKGRQLGSPADETWVRVEVVVRPAGDSRVSAGGATPEEVWGYSRWTRELAAELMGLDVPRVTMRTHRYDDDERSMGAMTEQYFRLLERRAAARGGWDQLGVEIGEYIAELARTRRARL